MTIIINSGRKMSKSRFSTFFIVISIVFITAGCQEEKKELVYSNFLSDYSRLEEDPKNEYLRIWEDESHDKSRYQKVIIEDVDIRLTQQAQETLENAEKETHQATIEELKKLSEYFREAAIESVEEYYSVVDNPGPDTMKVRCAITDLKPVDGFTNLISNIAIKVNLDIGSATIEAKFLDSQTDKPFLEMVECKKGQQFLSFFEGIDKWGHTKAAFRQWSDEMLLGYLDEIHGIERKVALAHKPNRHK